ncbi:HEAT repeat domain-containing protein [Candidatus Acetothermia bacterium]|jgi:hypothetical protein|nr:HEAT repeat domain-containing protein [Candidatus Acetothermia bacterium]MCI2430933.1 HEAT repeat domain-containing protein [Candidatus Acetothermia bacterium]MCI2437045.1 HEAT repeat domain-containing protein [Candidatus Acetothermia bacterium]
MTERDWWRVIFGSPIGEFSYEEHPAEETLRAYLGGKLARTNEFSLTILERGRLTGRAEVTAHLLTCARCAQLVARWRTESPRRSWWQILQERLSWQAGRREWQPVPRFARVVMTAQFALILGLSGLLYFKPAPFFSEDPSMVSPQKNLGNPAAPFVATPQTTLSETSSDLPKIITDLRDANSPNRLRAAQLLGESNDPRAIAALSEALQANDERLRGAARAALQQIQERFFMQAARLSHLLLGARLGALEERTTEFSRSFDVLTLFPFTVRVTFREDTSAREIETIVRKFNGFLTYAGREEFLLQLPMSAGLNLNEVVRELSIHPQIKTVRR